MKNQKINIKERLELSVKRLCGHIPPDKRVWVVLTMLLLFGLGSFYMTISSVYNYGKREGRIENEIRHIEIERFRSPAKPAPAPEPETEPAADTLDTENLPVHERNADE